jgi:hypothetical protein
MSAASSPSRNAPTGPNSPPDGTRYENEATKIGRATGKLIDDVTRCAWRSYANSSLVPQSPTRGFGIHRAIASSPYGLHIIST